MFKVFKVIISIIMLDIFKFENNFGLFNERGEMKLIL